MRGRKIITLQQIRQWGTLKKERKKWKKKERNERKKERKIKTEHGFIISLDTQNEAQAELIC